MHAMVLKQVGSPLAWTELPDRQPGPGEIRVEVAACGVCRTDLHVVDGELPHPQVPIIPGHEIVGRIDAVGPGVEGLVIGQRVGIPWLGHTCGVCPYCKMQRENLCDHPLFTGYTRDGGFATATVADARFAFPLGEEGSDESLAPLLCAGLIGGLGIAPGANIGDTLAVFEPVHGAAPKYKDLNKVNPTAMLLSAILMLRHLKEENAADRLETAVKEVIAEGKSVTYDLKARPNDPTACGTQEMADAIIRKMGRK